jgi:DNA helicase-2/ATP-dependent DNA helicase PcrA
MALERIIATPPRGIGQKTIQQFTEWSLRLEGGQEAVFQELVKGNRSTSMSARAAASLQAFAELLDKWTKMRDDDGVGLVELYDTILADIEYETYLESRRQDRESDRMENIMELRRVVSNYEGYSLNAMLEAISLVSDLDNVDEDVNAPVLLTLHSAKGLEYPVVFLVGLEEGLLPHERSIQDDFQAAEERRLFYVGITRAKERLYITHAMTRRNYGYSDYTEPSRFLYDLPEDITQRHSPIQAQREAQRTYQQMRWVAAEESAPGYQPPQPDFKQGMVVSHPTFGRGIVISSKVHSDVEEVQVKFDSGALKRIDGSFLQKS